MIYISYPDIPAEALVRDTNVTFDSDLKAANLISGERYLRGKASSADGNLKRIVYDLGTTASVDNTKTANHLIIARADKLKTQNTARVRITAADQSGFGPTNLVAPIAWYKPHFSAVYDSAWRISQSTDLMGNYNATQSTDASKPLISRADNGENLFTGSEDFSTTYWPTQEGVTYSANATTNPVDGAATADSIVETSATSAHRITRQWTSVGKSYRMSVYYKKIGSSAANDNPRVVVNAGGGQFSDFVISTGAVSPGATLQTLADGWYRLISAPFTVVAGTPSARISLNQNGSYAGDGTTGAYLFGAQLHDANADLTYIPTTTFPQYRGLNGRRRPVFDGADDYLTSTATLADVYTAGSKAMVAVVVPNVLNAAQVIFGGGNAGKSNFRISSSGSQLEYFNDDGSLDYVRRPITAGIPYVVSFWHSGGFLNLATNGTAAIPVASGDTNSLTETLTFGARSIGSPGTQVFNGSIPELAIFNRALTTAERLAWESYLTSEWITPADYEDDDFQDSTLYGPNANDYLATFTATDSKRYFWFDTDVTAGSTGTGEHSKHYFGSYLDLGVGPKVKFTKSPESKSESTLSGTQDMLRLDELKYTFSLTWEGVSDAKVQEFEEKISKNADKFRYFLFTTEEHQLLNYERIINCKLTSYKTSNPARTINWNTIEATFEEVTG